MSFEGYSKNKIMTYLSNQYTLEDLELPQHGFCDIVFLVKSDYISINCNFPKFGNVELIKTKNKDDQVAIWSCRNDTIVNIKD